MGRVYKSRKLHPSVPQLALPLYSTINDQTMAFSGKWESESQSGYEEFCKLIGKLQLFKQLIFAVDGGKTHS